MNNYQKNIIVCVLLLTSCIKSDVEIRPAQIETLIAREITDISAVCGGRIPDIGTGAISEYGIELNGGNGYTKYARTVSLNDEFSVRLTRLTPQHTYRYRAYVNDGNIRYGSEKSFTTLPPFTHTATVDPDKMTRNSAVVSFTLTNRLKEWGVYYSETEATVNDPVKKEFLKPEITLSGLQPQTEYYILPYVKDKNDQITYLEGARFTTENVLSRVKGTYASPPKLENGRIDIGKLINELKDLNANTYNWLIWRGEKDWDDLQLFLPVAKKNKIDVWVTLVPYSESKPKTNWSSEPFQTDYVKWAEEIVKLSLVYPNLTALSIDDFVGWNMQFYTPEYTAEFVNVMHNINPQLAFVPCIYYNSTKITKEVFV